MGAAGRQPSAAAGGGTRGRWGEALGVRWARCGLGAKWGKGGGAGQKWAPARARPALCPPRPPHRRYFSRPPSTPGPPDIAQAQGARCPCTTGGGPQPARLKAAPMAAPVRWQACRDRGGPRRRPQRPQGAMPGSPRPAGLLRTALRPQTHRHAALMACRRRGAHGAAGAAAAAARPTLPPAASCRRLARSLPPSPVHPRPRPRPRRSWRRRCWRRWTRARWRTAASGRRRAAWSTSPSWACSSRCWHPT